MRSFITHVLTFLLGCVVAAFVVLSLARKTSLVWQDNFKTRIAYTFQQGGARAAEQQDWVGVEYAFQASQAVQNGAAAHEWDISLPLFGWSITGLAKEHDQTFWLVDHAAMAYALAQQGKTDEANAIYKKLADRYPDKDREYFNQVAIQFLSTLDSAPR
ncbi:tetratricopeptide repeat protein [Dyella sp.]|uniref:tetratricopeptide repeat protein n=1 Tax=Dyella sp. TaxID=1869338 RepID=UPI002ED16A85